MRVLRSKIPYLPYVFNFSDLEDSENLSLINLTNNTEEHESITEAFNNYVFKHIHAGKERTAVILRAEGFNYREIAWVMGLEFKEVHAILIKVKRRLIRINAKKHLK